MRSAAVFSSRYRVQQHLGERAPGGGGERRALVRRPFLHRFASAPAGERSAPAHYPRGVARAAVRRPRPEVGPNADWMPYAVH